MLSPFVAEAFFSRRDAETQFEINIIQEDIRSAPSSLAPCSLPSATKNGTSVGLTIHASQPTTHNSQDTHNSQLTTHNSQPQHLHPLLKNNIHRNALLFQPVQIPLQLRPDHRHLLDEFSYTIVIPISLQGEYLLR